MTFASDRRRPFEGVDVGSIQVVGSFENGLILIVACLIAIGSISQVFQWPSGSVGTADQV